MKLKLTKNELEIIEPLTEQHAPCLAATQNGKKIIYYPSCLTETGTHQIGNELYFYSSAFISIGYSPDGKDRYFVCNNKQYHEPHNWTYILNGGNINGSTSDYVRTVYVTEDSIRGSDYNYYTSTTTETVSPGTVSKVGYTFSHWTEDDTVYQDSSTHSTKTDAVFKANWTQVVYSISYNGNGGTVTPASGSPTSYTIETSTITFASPSSASRTGYTFKSWSPSSIPIGSINNKTIYAQWNPITYSISYNGNGGTVNSSSPSSYNIESSTITLSGSASRTGYTFTGWSPSSIAHGSTGDKTAYAQWSLNTYSISYVSNAYGNYTLSHSNPSSYTVNSGTITFSAPSDQDCWDALQKYRWDGWSPSSIPAGSTGNVTVQGTWKKVSWFG